MSRSGYSDDCEHLELWRSNVRKTINGKKGQAFLRELIDALDAMPEKRLISGSLVEEHGQVCAIGAVGVKRAIPMKALDPEDPQQVGKVFGISSMLAQEIASVNDDHHESQTPEERWTGMRAWAEKNLKSQEKAHA